MAGGISRLTDAHLNADLLAVLRRAISIGTTIMTLSNGKPNVITDIGPEGVTVETERSRALGAKPQLVPAWMIEAAWERLTESGSLTHADLSHGRLNGVCRVRSWHSPGVQVASRRPIVLRFAT